MGDQLSLNVSITGFRSLKDFRAPIDQGLNVILGPNGSGKSNFVSALEFFSRFASGGLRSAIGTAGGATRVFRHENILEAKAAKGKARRRAVLTIRIDGHLRIANPLKLSHRRAEGPDYIDCEIGYGLSLSMSVDDFSVRVDNEYLNFECEPEIRTKFESNIFNITATAIRKNGNRSFGTSDDFARRTIVRFAGEDSEYDQLADLNSALYFNAKSGHSLFSLGIYSGLIAAVRNTLSFPRSVNIVPDKVRAQDDIASANFVSPDGTGVIATLHDMLQSPNRRMFYSSDAIGPHAYERIVDIFKRVNDNIVGIEIMPNFETGRLECFVYMDDVDQPIRLPFAWLSDGTVKWLAIVTLVTIRSGGYCLEEPENYLHPRAQRVFFEYLRGVTENNPSAYMVVTTHSETIINCCKINELVLTNYEDGRTTARKIEHAESVIKMINDTGFGLGYFYTMGDLSDA